MTGKSFTGSVTSNEMTKTLVVSMNRRFQDSRIGKIVSTRKKFKVHSEDATVKIGDVIEFVECRPMSKEKKFRLTKVLKRAEQALEANVDASLEK